MYMMAQMIIQRGEGQSGGCAGERPASSAKTERAIAMSALHAHELAMLIQIDESQSGESGERPAFSATTERVITMSALNEQNYAR